MGTHGSSAGLREHGRATAWALALTAGCVVAFCYLQLGRVEVGPMSGNTVATATRSTADTSSMRVCAIAAFVVGVAAGIVIVEECARRNVRRVLAIMLVVEIAFLVAFVAWGAGNLQHGTLHASSQWAFDAIVTLPAFAMGLQTAALRRIGGQTARTVFITGILTRSAEEAVRYAYWKGDREAGRERPWRNEPSAARLILLIGIVVAYVCGAVLAGWLNGHWHIWTMSVPLALLAVVAALDAALDVSAPAR